jgi:Translation elongation factor Ts
LLEQQFIKDPERKVNDLLTEAVATLGENIIINRFTRYAIGESSDSSQSQ